MPGISTDADLWWRRAIKAAELPPTVPIGMAQPSPHEMAELARYLPLKSDGRHRGGRC